MALLQIFWIISLQITAVLSVPAIVNGPSDVVAQVGDTNVKLKCAARLEKGTGAEDALAWVNAAGNNVYNSIDGVLKPYDQIYSIEKIASQPTEHHNLIIKQAKITDGNKMTCKLLRGTDAKDGQLVVMEPPKLALRDMEEGKATIEECKLEYGAVATGESRTGVLPKLLLSVEGKAVPAQETRVEGKPGTTPHTLTRYVNYTGRGEDNGKNITCKAFTTIPAYQLTTTGIMNVQFAARTPVVWPKNQFKFAVGESLNCTSAGNPSPTVSWKRIPPPGSRGTGVLTVMKEMMGSSNKWECSAQNQRNKNPLKVSINFTVVEGPLPTQGTEAIHYSTTTVMTVLAALLFLGAWW